MNWSVAVIAVTSLCFVAVAPALADAPQGGAFAEQKLSAEEMAELLGSLPKRSPVRRTEDNPVILQALAGLQWGMGSQQVIDALARDSKLDPATLRKGYVTFDGQATEWEDSAVGGQYTHGNGEAMLVIDQGGVRSYLFFIQDKLWKRFETVAQAQRTDNFHRFARDLRLRFGAGHVRTEATDRWIEFGTKRTRVRGLDGGDDATRFGVVLEDRAVLDKLQTMRVATIEPVRIAPSAPVKLAQTSAVDEAAAAKIAADDQVRAKARAKARAGALRPKVEDAAAAAKRAVTPPVAGELDAMAAVEDDDPLTGL